LGIEKEVAEFRAGQEPAETKEKNVQWTFFLTRLGDSGWKLQEKIAQTCDFYISKNFFKYIIFFLTTSKFIYKI